MPGRSTSRARLARVRPTVIIVAGTRGFSTIGSSGRVLTGAARTSAWVAGMKRTLTKLVPLTRRVVLLAVRQHLEPHEFVDVDGRQGGLVELDSELLHADGGNIDHGGTTPFGPQILRPAARHSQPISGQECTVFEGSRAVQGGPRSPRMRSRIARQTWIIIISYL